MGCRFTTPSIAYGNGFISLPEANCFMFYNFANSHTKFENLSSKYLKSLTPDALQAPDHGDVAGVPVHPDGKVHVQPVQGGPGQHLPVRRLLHQLTDGPALAQPTQPNVLGQQLAQIGGLQLSNIVAGNKNS